MSGFTKTVSDQIEFDGDTITITLARMSRKDMAKFAPYIEMSQEGGGKMKFNDSMELMEIASEILPEYVRKFDGLKDAESKPIELSTVLEESYFISLVSNIVTMLMEISTPDQDAEKN